MIYEIDNIDEKLNRINIPFKIISGTFGIIRVQVEPEYCYDFVLKCADLGILEDFHENVDS